MFPEWTCGNPGCPACAQQTQNFQNVWDFYCVWRPTIKYLFRHLWYGWENWAVPVRSLSCIKIDDSQVPVLYGRVYSYSENICDVCQLRYSGLTASARGPETQTNIGSPENVLKYPKNRKNFQTEEEQRFRKTRERFYCKLSLMYRHCYSVPWIFELINPAF